MSHRNPKVLGEWGPGSRRSIAAESYWKLPFAWDRQARESGVRRRVFCASLADVFEDREDLVEPKRRLFKIIASTPNLDWLLLTKRPEIAVTDLPILVRCMRGDLAAYARRRPLSEADRALQKCLDSKGYFPNVWLGFSAENQEWFDRRWPFIRDIPAAVRWVSYEPALGPIDFAAALGMGHCGYYCDPDVGHVDHGPTLDWLVIGGESDQGGRKARPFDLAWARSAVAQCKAAGVPAFVKQLGSAAVDEVNGVAGRSLRVDPDAAGLISLRLRDRAGADPSEWPEDLRVRQYPRASL